MQDSLRTANERNARLSVAIQQCAAHGTSHVTDCQRPPPVTMQREAAPFPGRRASEFGAAADIAAKSLSHNEPVPRFATRGNRRPCPDTPAKPSGATVHPRAKGNPAGLKASAAAQEYRRNMADNHARTSPHGLPRPPAELRAAIERDQGGGVIYTCVQVTGGGYEWQPMDPSATPNE